MDLLCMQCAVHCMWPCMLDHPCLFLACWCCRGHRLWNMQPLSGWRLSDWIRSDAVMMSRVPFLVELRVDVASTRAAHWNPFHISPRWAAGAVASSACVLCIAGTYQTGSGRMQRWMSGVACLYDSCDMVFLVPWIYSACSVPCTACGLACWIIHAYFLRVGAAGATASGTCSLCQAGAYQTGSGRMQ